MDFEAIKRILEAGNAAPTWNHNRNWSYIVLRTDKDWETLCHAIPQELSLAIEKNKMSAGEYLAGKGKEYRNTPFLKVYGHAGTPCPVCGSDFEKITIGGRGSCYCPKCQKPNL